MTDRVHIPPIVPSDIHHGCRVVAMSDVGRVREENQDFMGYFRLDAAQLLVVADGMGGHSGGYEASRIAVDKIRQVFVEQAASLPPDEVLATGVRAANKQVRSVASANSEFEGLGSTVVMVLVQDRKAWVAHVGDSRAYLLRGGDLSRLTVDHSRVNRMIQAGLIAAEDAEDHPMGHILERSIGCADEVEAEIGEVLLVRGDRLVLCSDGFWGTVEDSEICDLFSKGSLRDAVERGIGLALARGADDNTTIGALEFVGGDRTAGAPPRAGETLRVLPVSASEAQGLVRPEADRRGMIRLLVGASVGLLALGAILLLSLRGDDEDSDPGDDDPALEEQDGADRDKKPDDAPEAEPPESDGDPDGAGDRTDPTDRKQRP